jgi:hypothetical protein
MRKLALFLVMTSRIVSAQTDPHIGGQKASEGLERGSSFVEINSIAGSDIGAKINQYISTFGPVGTIIIPSGSHSFATPIVITQLGGQNILIHCQSRSAVLTYTGTGDAIKITAGGALNAQVKIENCSLQNGGAATNGIHIYHAQNTHLINNVISGFTGADLLGEGSINGYFAGNDFQSGGYPVKLMPDTAHSFASNANRFYGGTMVYGEKANFWDAGNLSAYGGDTSNILDGVTLEMSANRPQFIVEGTWNDCIQNSYIEYIKFPTATAELYGGVVGNIAGSGFGSNLAYTAYNFRYIGNYMITPAPGRFESASLWAANTVGLHVENLTDEGAPSYAISFQTTGSTTEPFVGPATVMWQKGMYRNAPRGGFLWVRAGWPMGLGQYAFTPNGFAFGGMMQATGGVFAGGALTTITALATPTLLAGTTGSSGILHLRDNTLGGSAVFLIDPNAGAQLIGTSQIAGTISVTFRSGNWYVALASGATPRAIVWTIFG